jgi:glycosyltransferase involved in cell wall biosynthesis
VVALDKRGPLDCGAWWRLVCLLRDERIDLVHTHLWGANFWGRLAAWWVGRPAVATEHSTDTWKPWWYFLLDRWLARRCARVVTVSDAVRTFYQRHGIPAEKLQTIANGVETEQFPAPERSVFYDQLGWGVQTPVLLAIGRLVEPKRFEVFIDLMAEVIAQRPQARALIVGEGRLRAALEAQIHSKGLSGHVVLAGLREDVPALIRGARAVVFTSEREGLPMVLIEAMASGVPVVSTAVGGIPEVLMDERTGWLVPAGHPEAMLPRLLAVIDDPSLAQRVGAAAQGLVRERWSAASMARRHEALYEALLHPRTRVVHVIDHLDPGGAQSQLLELARHLPRERWACHVISLSATQGTLLPEFQAAGIPVTRIAQQGRWSWSCFWALRQALRSLRPDIVHTWLFTADLYGRLAARTSGVPVLITAVRSVEPSKPWHYVAVDAGLQHLTDAITINAEAIRPVLRRREHIRGRKIHTIYNGIDGAMFSPAAVNGAVRESLGWGAAPVVGLVSRLMPEKDPATFVRAALMVAGTLPTARFLIVGHGPLAPALQEMVRAAHVSDRFVFTGYRRDRAACLQAMDIVVLSSLYEGCANAILEAMAMAKPVVATRVGGNPELVVEGLTGLLVPSADPEALAAALQALLQDPTRARAMGRAGRARIEAEFTISRMVQGTAALYTSLLQNKE